MTNQLVPLIRAAALLKRAGRGMHRRLCGAPGCGKTRLAARCLIPYDLFYRDEAAALGDGLPIVAIDPGGALSVDLLDFVDRLPPAVRGRVADRIVYIDVAGHEVGGETYVHPFPLLFRHANESLYDVGQRYLEVIERADPVLQSAGIQGMNAIAEVGEHALMALFAMGHQISECRALLADPASFEGELRRAAAAQPEAGPAIAFFLPGGGYLAMTERQRHEARFAFLRKIAMFTLDPTARAQYAAARPSLTPQEVVANRLCVILDFHGIQNKRQRQTAVLWLFKYFNDHFARRGPAGKHDPVAFYVDELAALLPSGQVRDKLIADDVAQLLSVHGRNNGVFCTLIHQDLMQFDYDTNVLLARLGTQVIGRQSDVKGAQQIGERFFRYDKLKAKAYRPQRAVFAGDVVVLGEDPVYETAQEQAIANGYKFLDLETFQFLVGVAPREGTPPTTLRPISFAELDEGVYPRDEEVRRLRSLLMRRRGRRVSDVLREIGARRSADAAGWSRAPAAPLPAQPSPDLPVHGSVRVSKRRAPTAAAVPDGRQRCNGA